MESLLDEISIQRDAAPPTERSRDKCPEGSLLRLAYVRWSGCGTRVSIAAGGQRITATPAFEAFRAYCETHANRDLSAACGCGTERSDTAEKYRCP